MAEAGRVDERRDFNVPSAVDICSTADQTSFSSCTCKMHNLAGDQHHDHNEERRLQTRTIKYLH